MDLQPTWPVAPPAPVPIIAPDAVEASAGFGAMLLAALWPEAADAPAETGDPALREDAGATAELAATPQVPGSSVAVAWMAPSAAPQAGAVFIANAAAGFTGATPHTATPASSVAMLQPATARMTHDVPAASPSEAPAPQIERALVSPVTPTASMSIPDQAAAVDGTRVEQAPAPAASSMAAAMLDVAEGTPAAAPVKEVPIPLEVVPGRAEALDMPRAVASSPPRADASLPIKPLTAEPFETDASDRTAMPAQAVVPMPNDSGTPRDPLVAPSRPSPTVDQRVPEMTAPITPPVETTPRDVPAEAPPPTAPPTSEPAAPSRAATPVLWPARQVAPFAVALALGPDASVTLTLDPVELGVVEVSIERAPSGEAAVRVTAERPETLALLQRDSRDLERALSSAGLGEGAASLSFGLGGGSARDDAPRDGGRGHHGGAAGPSSEKPDETVARRGLLDLAI